MANKSLLSPRLAVIWSPSADGPWALSANFARYVMPMTSNVAASTTAAGNAATYQWLYQGPAVNANPTDPLTMTEPALRQVFDWFNANGGQSRPLAFAFVPGTNVQIPHSLNSPNAREYGAGVSCRTARGPSEWTASSASIVTSTVSV